MIPGETFKFELKLFEIKFNLGKLWNSWIDFEFRKF